MPSNHVNPIIGQQLLELSGKLSSNLATITAFHHREDVEIFRSWRGIVHICDEDLSNEHPGDSRDFGRAMWERY